MPKSKPPYPAGFRQQMVELVQAGRTPAELSREFGVSAQSISTWVTRAAADAGRPVPGKDALTSAEREELARLRRDLKRVTTERDILAKGDEDDETVQWTVLLRNAWFAGRSETTHTPSTR